MEDSARTADRRPSPADGYGVRPMRIGDVPFVLAIERMAFSTPWSARTFYALLKRRDTSLVVADPDAEGIAGYAVVWIAGPEAELGDLAVRENARGRGIGRRLVQEVLEIARGRGADAVFLEVRQSNTPARRLYERLGFERVGRRADYYADPKEDALILRRTL